MSELARSDRSLIAEWRRMVDWPILSACFTLIAIGLVLSLAAGPPAAERLGYADYHFVFRHAVFACAGAGLLIAASLLDDQWTRRAAAAVFVAAFFAMAFILLFGHEAKGAQRWIRIGGFSLQPSEAVKPALIVVSAWLLAQRQLYPAGPWMPVAFAFYITTVGLLLLQPDVGQTALLTAAFITTFFVSGLPWKWASAFAAGGAALAAALYALLPHVRWRVNSFLFPTEYDTGQIDRAQEAIARGGVFGAGPGEGSVKRVLPEAHNDFVYSVAGEEFGLLATLGLIALIAFIALRGLRLAARLDDLYPRAAATGLFVLFGLQSAINIAVNLGMIPAKGMTLPFVSYGGSSMLGAALTLGFALALVRRARPRLRVRRAYA